MRFNKKTAIVTGAASGMGLLFSQNWAALGGNVVLCDINETALREKAEEINDEGKGNAIGMVCDVRDYGQICAVCERAAEAFGGIDLLVNFAGGTAVRMQRVDREKHPEFPDVPIEVYDWGIDVNLKGPFYFAHAVLKEELDAGHPVDVAIDCLGGDVMGKCIHYLKHGARWIMIAALAGQFTQIDLKNIYVRNVRIIGSTLRSRTPQVKAQILAELVEKVWPKVEKGEVKPTIHQVLPIQEAEAAQEILYQGKNVGKVVLKI